MTEDEVRAHALALIPQAAAPLTLGELEQYLAKAADLLRGSDRPGRLQGLHLPADVLQADQRRLPGGVRRRRWTSPAATTSSPPSPRTTASPSPTGCLWHDVRERTENVGAGAAYRAARDREGQPGDAVRHLRQRHVDEQGQAARPQAVRPDRALLDQAADQRRRRPGRVRQRLRVPDQAVRRPVQQEGRRVLHPALGGRRCWSTSSTRRRARRSTTRPAAPAACSSRSSSTSRRAGGRPQTLWGKLYGQEKVLTTSGIARMNLLLHGVEDFKIVRDDTLRNPAFFDRHHGWPRSTA